MLAVLEQSLDGLELRGCWPWLATDGVLGRLFGRLFGYNVR